MTLLILATAFFVLLQGVFSGMEMGMVSLRKPRVEHAAKKGHPTAKILMFFISNPGVMITTMLIGVNVGVVCASLTAKELGEALGLSHGYGLIASSCVMSVILLCFEIIPKNWFRQAPFERCSLFAYPLYATYAAFSLPIKAAAAMTDLLSSSLSKNAMKHGKSAGPLMREDLRLFLRESESEGLIEAEASAILDNAIDFHSMTVDSIKIPRSQVWDLPSSATIKEAFDYCRQKAISKIPVYRQDVSAAGPGSAPCPWIGIFSVQDAMFSIPEEFWTSTRVAACLRPAHSVDAKAGMEEILDKARRSKVQLFIVMDSSKGEPSQTGIVTPEDVARRLFET